MAETVVVAHGDTLINILKSKRGIKDHDTYAWLGKLRPINPHIGDLNRIYPGERLLLPDTLVEAVGDAQVWQNAFDGIPPALDSPHNGHARMFLAMPGNTIDSIAKSMFDNSPYIGLPLSAKRAVLIHNNPDLIRCLDTGRVPRQMILGITPLRLSRFDKAYWQHERPAYLGYLQDMTPLTREMFQGAGPETSCLLAGLVQALSEAGAAVGGGGAVTGISSGAAAASELGLARINGLARQIYADASAQFGRKAAASLTKANLAKMARFITSHPSYPALMREIEQVPRALLPMSRARLMPPAVAGVNAQVLARHFSKQYFQAFRHWPSGKYMGTIARQLNGRINFFKAMGRHATWYVPAVIGLYNVYEASPEMRVRTLFEEGFGVVGGWGGTELGVAMGLGIVAVLGLGPLGLFITVFICASAVGMAGNLAGKNIGSKIYDYGTGLDYGQIFHSPEQLIESF